MKSKKVLWIVGVLVICSLVAVLVGVLHEEPVPEERLTPEQIAALRDEYPLITTLAPPLVDLRRTNIEEIKEHVDSFVYGEVTGDIMKFTSPMYGFKRYEYPFTVIDDSQGKYATGEQITVAASMEFKDYNPQLYKGMKIVLRVSRDDEVPSRSYFGSEGSFYVTPDGYTLPVVEDEEDTRYYGWKVDYLLKLLKK